MCMYMSPSGYQIRLRDKPSIGRVFCHRSNIFQKLNRLGDDDDDASVCEYFLVCRKPSVERK